LPASGGSAGKVEGLVTAVTGGATGIGRAIAERFVAEGAQVVVGQLGAERAAHVAGTSMAELDVREEEGVERFVAGVVERHGGLDVLVNNAALTGPPVLAPLLEHSPQLFRDVLETNLMGTFLMTKAAARAMIAGDRQGRIINLASIDSFVAEEFAAGYVASKAGILGLTRASAVELAPHRITVNAIAPGQIFTEAGTAANEMVGGHAFAYRHYRAGPLGEGGEPGDVAAVAAFLASPECRWISGTTVVVDGGYLAS
jgi:NAD(P)-dependent dehydrogenase (short-subunit alcohol dehydrogenase family)